MSSENTKQGNPLATEKIGKLIAKFAVTAVLALRELREMKRKSCVQSERVLE